MLPVCYCRLLPFRRHRPPGDPHDHDAADFDTTRAGRTPFPRFAFGADLRPGLRLRCQPALRTAPARSDLAGSGKTAVLTAAVYGVWSSSSFEGTAVLVGGRLTQWIMLAVMGLGLFMNASLGEAFTERPRQFVAPFLLIQVGRPIVTALSAPHPELRRHYWHVVVWVMGTAPLWLVGAPMWCVKRRRVVSWLVVGRRVCRCGSWRAGSGCGGGPGRGRPGYGVCLGFVCAGSRPG